MPLSLARSIDRRSNDAVGVTFHESILSIEVKDFHRAMIPDGTRSVVAFFQRRSLAHLRIRLRPSSIIVGALLIGCKRAVS